MDFKKAFDSINRKALFHKLEKYVAHGDYLNILQDMYAKAEFSVKLQEGRTPYFDTSVGLKQGCILSPILFSLYINDLVDIFDDECRPVNLDQSKISCLLYADDLVILSESATGLQTYLDKLNDYCNRWNLKINMKKTHK